MSRTQRRVVGRDEAARIRAAVAGVPVSAADLAALEVYALDHSDGRPWRYRFVRCVRSEKVGLLRCVAEVADVTPRGTREYVRVCTDAATERAAAAWVVKYLKWRHGDRWRGAVSGKPPAPVEAFDDAAGTGGPPSWVGRVWVGGRPAFAFADEATEAGFRTEAEAVAAARSLVAENYGEDWRWHLGRYPRPWLAAAAEKSLAPRA